MLTQRAVFEKKTPAPARKRFQARIKARTVRPNLQSPITELATKFFRHIPGASLAAVTMAAAVASSLHFSPRFRCGLFATTSLVLLICTSGAEGLSEPKKKNVSLCASLPGSSAGALSPGSVKVPPLSSRVDIWRSRTAPRTLCFQWPSGHWETCIFSPALVLSSTVLSQVHSTLVALAARPSVPGPTLHLRMASDACFHSGTHVTFLGALSSASFGTHVSSSCSVLGTLFFLPLVFASSYLVRPVLEYPHAECNFSDLPWLGQQCHC